MRVRSILAAALVFGALPAVAHQAPAVLGVVAEQDGTATALRVAHGLVAKDAEERWRFICPRTWEGPDAPLAQANDQATIFAFGSTGVFQIDPLAVPAPLTTAGLNATSVQKLQRGRGSVFALAGNLQSSVVVKLDPGRALPVLEASRRIHSIAVDGDELWTATPTTGAVQLYQYKLDGEAKAMDRFPYAQIEGATISIEASGGRIYAIFAHLSGWTLARAEIDATFTEIATSTTPFFGPVHTLEADVVVKGGALYRIAGDALELVDASRTYTCAEGGEANAWLCARTELFQLETDGSVGPRVFDMKEVRGPRLGHFDEGAAIACRIEWEDFAREAGLDPAIPSSSADGGIGKDEEESGCSCSTESRVPRSWLAMWMASGMIFASRRRRSRR